MTLMANGKKVVALALGDNEFYSISEIKIRVSDPFKCSWHPDPTYHVSINLNQKLSSGSDLIVKDLIDKREQISLTLTFHSSQTNADYLLHSGIIDFSKPDSNGHFNFQWVKGTTSTNAYCCSDSDQFETYSDALGAYASADYDSGTMTILYSDGR